MSTYSYTDYYNKSREEMKSSQGAALKECPHCNTPINQHLGMWEKPHPHCGATACRSALYRLNKANRLEEDRTKTKDRIWQYCTDNLTEEQRRAVMDMTHQLMEYNATEGHKIAEGIVKVIDRRSCKHDNIKVLIDNAAIAERRREKTADFASELQALYERRIYELEKEIEVYRTLEFAVYQVALDQERKQPDPGPRAPLPEITPEEAAEAADHQRDLEKIRAAGLRPLSDLTAAELAALDGEEFSEEDEEGEESEEGEEFSEESEEGEE